MFAPNATSSASAPSSAAEPLASVLDGRVGLFARGVAPVRVRVVVQEVLGHGVGHDAGHLRAAGSIEVGDAGAAVHPIQRWKRGADVVETWRAHHGL